MATEALFLAAGTYAVYRDVRGYFPTPTTSPAGKRLRGQEPHATVDAMASDTCDPGARPPRIGGSHLSTGFRKEVKACCESLLEAKYVDSAVSGSVPTFGSGRVTCLNDLGQGTTAQTRVGNKILNKVLKVEGLAYLPANAASDVYRLIIVIDHECFGSICNYAQYIQGGGTSDLYALPSAETVGKDKRFTVLVDKLIPLNNVVGTTDGAVHWVPFSISIPLACSTTYSGNVGTYSDIVKNSLCAIEVSKQGVCGSEWVARLTYLDG